MRGDRTPGFFENKSMSLRICISLSSSWCFGKVPMWGWGGGAQQLQCKSESVQCSEKQQSPCEGGGGGLKLEKINAGITIKSTPSSPHLRKNWA